MVADGDGAVEIAVGEGLLTDECHCVGNDNVAMDIASQIAEGKGTYLDKGVGCAFMFYSRGKLDGSLGTGVTLIRGIVLVIGCY